MAEQEHSSYQASGCSPKPTSASGRTTQSCVECRRRRIRCDGQQVPCAQCSHYQVPDRCQYPLRRSRQTPSAKAYADLSNTHEKSREILNKLFPYETIEGLHQLSRRQLLDLLGEPLPPASEQENSEHRTCGSPTATILELEPSPYQEHIWDETPEGQQQQLPCEDDVNGMSALFKSGNHSYLGISSVPTILRVMADTSPQLQHAIKQRVPSDSAYLATPSTDYLSTLPTFDEPVLVDAYFRTVHAITPMVDELDFRQRYAKEDRGGTDITRGPWLALLNMVLTLGYIAANDDTQDGHALFYDRAAANLGFACFATGHIYTLQALVLFGGYYLHYLNKPNVASAVMGAAHRMALAMGLQRLPPMDKTPPARRATAESRSRTWLCLFCLDTWAGTTLGRLEMGVWSLSSMAVPTACMSLDLDYENISMNASAAFSLIAARIQDRMARLPLISPLELKKFDEELLAWHGNLHPVMRSGLHTPERVRAACLLLHYRYLNQRMTLYRPYLLIYALKTSSKDESPTEYTVATADTCCEIAQESIRVITESWYPNQLLAWNSSWFLFQASLVVLSKLMSSNPPSKTQNLESSIIDCLTHLDQMRKWRSSAAQTHDLISFIFDARGACEQEWDSSYSLPDGALVDLFGFGSNMDGSDWAGILDVSGDFSREVFGVDIDAPP